MEKFKDCIERPMHKATQKLLRNDKHQLFRLLYKENIHILKKRLGGKVQKLYRKTHA